MGKKIPKNRSKMKVFRCLDWILSAQNRVQTGNATGKTSRGEKRLHINNSETGVALNIYKTKEYHLQKWEEGKLFLHIEVSSQPNYPSSKREETVSGIQQPQFHPASILSQEATRGSAHPEYGDKSGKMTQDPGSKGKTQKKEKRAQTTVPGSPPRTVLWTAGLCPPRFVSQEGGLWKVPELRQAVRVGPPVRQGTSLTRGRSTRRGNSRKVAVCKPPRQSYRTHNADTWILDFQPPELWKLLLFKPPSLQYFCSGSWNRLDKELCSRLRVPVHTENGTDSSLLASPESSSVLDTLQDIQLELMINSGPEA